MREDTIKFTPGFRKEALEAAIKIIKERGQSAEIVICRDIPGKHTGGADCFCDPKIIIINEDGSLG